MSVSRRGWIGLLALAVLSACEGAIGGGAAGPRGTEGPFGEDVPIERGPTPVRALQAVELANALQDVFPELGRQEIRLSVTRTPSRYSTYASDQLVTASTLSVMDTTFAAVAARLAEGEASMGCSVEAEGRACVEAFAWRVLPRLYRRDPTPEEVARLGAIYEAQRAQDDAGTALRTTLRALLMSPSFLYSWTAALGRAPDERTRLQPHEIAERLALVLWASVPDDALLTAARDGSLAHDEGVAAQAARMMDDPRFDRFVHGFFAEWMHYEDLEAVTKDPSAVPEWRSELTHDMRHEAERFLSTWAREEGTLESLFTSRRRFLTPELASFLNLEGLGGQLDTGAIASDPEQASGIFTLAAFTASRARPSARFGPTLRGHWIRTRLLCGVVGTPDPDVISMAPAEDPSLPIRAWHEELMSNPTCGACHSRMDELGFSLEHFDGAGRFRELDVGHPIDASATVLGSLDPELDGSYPSIVELAPALAQSPVVADCMAQHLTEYALGTDQSRATRSGELSRRSTAIDAVASDLAGPGLRSALLTLLTSEAFLTAEGER